MNSKQMRLRFCLLYSSKARGQMYGLVSHFTRLPLKPLVPNQVSAERQEMFKHTDRFFLFNLFISD